MMDRVFQHFEGKVDALSGVAFSHAKAFIDKDGDDVVLLWLQESSGIWFRVFID
ncbi:hypothetical protein [Pseudoalteromonas obscura]|uniref:Uncharacterized protein n=1 Tax=Pseudoalteromonas obscura TaxID=3048491 RepID=A0ABT7EER7_9GAMM|nr:hypothetical protein [Pseudoalteromonas sp. P94(2023)]MDK2593538.1 hypothetical protein [Pseudoalteromonas sp. P94(2023)]